MVQTSSQWMTVCEEWGGPGAPVGLCPTGTVYSTFGAPVSPLRDILSSKTYVTAHRVGSRNVCALHWHADDIVAIKASVEPVGLFETELEPPTHCPTHLRQPHIFSGYASASLCTCRREPGSSPSLSMATPMGMYPFGSATLSRMWLYVYSSTRKGSPRSRSSARISCRAQARFWARYHAAGAQP